MSTSQKKILVVVLLVCWCEDSSSLEGRLDAVPTVDLLAGEVAVKTLRLALRQFGFFYIKNHGINQSLIQAQFEASRGVFALPDATKRHKELIFEPALDIGYLNNQALDEISGKKDTKEGFLLTNNGVLDKTFTVDPNDPLKGATLKWPPVEGYELTMREWTRQLYGLNHRLNALLFQALGLTDSDRLKLARQPFVVVKQLRYSTNVVRAQEGLGAGAHADWGAFTILATDDVPGLEIEVDTNEWLPVPPRRDCLIVNAGDQIHFWTRGYFKSANHRVVVSSSLSDSLFIERYSTAFFAYFDRYAFFAPLATIANLSASDETLLDPMSEGTTTAEYFSFKLCESVGKTPEDCRAADDASETFKLETVNIDVRAGRASSSSSSSASSSEL